MSTGPARAAAANPEPAAHNWPAILFAASLFAAASFMPLNIMPLLLGSAADTFGLGNEDLGRIGSSFLAGFTLLSVTAFFWIERVNWRLVLILASAAAAAGFAAVPGLPGVILNYLYWGMLGFVAAAPYTVVVRILSESSNTNRAFGWVTAVQIGASAVLLWLLPAWFMKRWGFDSIVLALTAGFLAAAPAALMLPGSSGRLKRNAPAPTAAWFGRDTLPVWIALAAAFFFISGQIGVWAFLERIGHAQHLSTELIGRILAVLKVIGALAGLTLFALGTRIKGVLPHAACTVLVIAGLALLAAERGTATYALGAWLWEYGLSLYYVYLYALIAVLDSTRRLVVLTPAAVSCGAALGPWIAGRLAAGGDFHAVLLYAGVAVAVPALVLALSVARGAEAAARMRAAAA